MSIFNIQLNVVNIINLQNANQNDHEISLLPSRKSVIIIIINAENKSCKTYRETKTLVHWW